MKLFTESVSLNRRIKQLGSSRHNEDGHCILYVMSRDQRVYDNHTLLAAQDHALKSELPLAVIFVLNTTVAARAREHYEFMTTGLRRLEQLLAALHIPLIGLVGESANRLQGLFYHLKPAAVYMDFNPLNGPRALWRSLAAAYPILVVDSHNLIPVWTASDKQEYNARTIRPKIHRHLADFLHEPDKPVTHPHDWPNRSIIPIKEVVEIFDDRLQLVARNHTKHRFIPGEQAALASLDDFIEHRFAGYAVRRNDPATNGTSNLSPYLHFGHISSLRILLEAGKALAQDPILRPDYDALLEEIIVRKELSDNYCYYNHSYLSLDGVPGWAQRTLDKHRHDARPFLYTLSQFEQAATHDDAWNAAQRQLTMTGKMHGYMRMYWAKKVLEWSPSPEDALHTLVYLNDFYSLDGGDPNGYVGILWSIAGLHDRPWAERPVYGTIRTMTSAGLKRKFDITSYIKQN